MVKEFQLPINEGPIYTVPSVFIKFQPEEFPVEIGSLEKEAFSYLGEWYQAMKPEGYGVAYKLGIKEEIIDKEGDLADLLIFFGAPLAKKGLNITDDIANILYKQLGKVMETIVIQASSSYDNLIAILMSPPEYMFKELQERLSR